MADINRGDRPLSPHLQVYKLPIAAVTSILTRITGHALVVGLVLIAWWLLAAVTGPRAFAAADWVLQSWLGFLVLSGSVWALWFHALAGVRHWFYDAGLGMGIDEARKSSWFILIAATVLTVLSVILYFVG